MKKILLIIIIILIMAGFGVTWKLIKKEAPLLITNFEECAKAGNPIMESYPRQCRHNGQTFTENIGNELEKTNLIRLDFPRPNQVVKSPLTITGEARGFWFFEASFPVVLTDWDGLIIGQGIATAKSDWMTSDFVPFEAKLTFTIDKNAYSNRGTLILRKDNPSGLSEYDDALEIPVVLAEDIESPACTKDSDCPSLQYICQEIQGTGTACPSTDQSCVPTQTIIQGECKLKEGNQCTLDSDCAAGNLCYQNICTSPIGRQCSGPSETSCPADFECVQGCGSPVGYPDEPPPPYFCQLKGYIRNCPICLAKNTLIDTPQGAIPVQEIQKGTLVWTAAPDGQRVIGIVIKTSKTPVPPEHKMVELILDDGRTLSVSPGHSTVDGRSVGELIPGDFYDGARVFTSNRVLYGDGATYDILPSGETGFYWANGILLDSTLH
ncbi:MAG: Gmad2 immunoglobulin-like domain-containing protein [Candidatus Nealsonbacteria bacterium]|nr:Gmad2 immunoglobulin-like domain-containing protein [Candidatus Nealsonbacteria bacterium]